MLGKKSHVNNHKLKKQESNTIKMENSTILESHDKLSQNLEHKSKPFKIIKDEEKLNFDSDNSWETAESPHKKVKRERDSADFSKPNYNKSEIWRIDQGLLPKCFSGTLNLDQHEVSLEDSNIGLLMKKYEDLKCEFLAKYQKNKGKYLPISLENKQLAKELDWPSTEGKSDGEDERRFVETRSQSENSPMEVESNEALTGVSILLPHESFEEAKFPFNNKCPFIILRDLPPVEKIERPRRKQSIIETEPFEMNKPYTIDLHVNSENQKIQKTPIGKNYQVEKIPLVLNKSQRPLKYTLKLIWRPDSVTEDQWNEYLDKVSEIIGEKITKEEAVARHLKKFGFNFEKAIEEIRKNKMAYKGHFRVCQTYLRNRSLNYQPKKNLSV